MSREAEGKEVTILLKVLDYFYEIRDKILDKLYWWEIKNFLSNLPKFIKQAWHWRGYDYIYTIEALCDNLDNLGNCIIKNDIILHSVRVGRRAKTASAMLRRAYGLVNTKEDTSFKNYMDNHCRVLRDIKNKPLKYDKDYSDKLWKVIRKRVDKIEEDRKKDAWKYLIKHIERMWY